MKGLKKPLNLLIAQILEKPAEYNGWVLAKFYMVGKLAGKE
jgi:hypothetical protein